MASGEFGTVGSLDLAFSFNRRQSDEILDPRHSTLDLHSVKPVYRLTWLAARTYYALWHRWRVCNAERVPVSGPVIAASPRAETGAGASGRHR